MAATSTQIDQQDFQPFLSVAFLQSKTGGATGAALAKVLVAEAKELIQPSYKQVTPPLKLRAPARTVIDTSAVSNQQGIEVATLVYAHEVPPSWLATKGLVDKAHHLVVIAVQDSMVAIAASDSAIRDQLARSLTSTTPLEPKRIADAFVGADAKTVWLSGVHSRTTVKADSKTLTGTALEHALDPLGDQTYVLSAIRSQPPIAGLKAAAGQAVVGTAPSSSRVWLGRPGSWTDFVKQIKLLLEHLKKAHKATDLYSFLSQPVADLSGVGKAYGLAVIPSVMLAEDAGLSDSDRQMASRWAYDTTYDVTAKAGANLSVDVTSKDVRLGVAELTVKAGKVGRISITGSWTTKGASTDEDRAACLTYLRDPGQVKVYYDTGHTLADGYCYLAGWTDHVLKWKFHNFKGYNLWQEKPELNGNKRLADSIDVPKDPSLFSFVQQVLFKYGWLACDDGAMELADFVHLDPIEGRITLIHVKGAGTKKGFKQLSVSDYEVVVSQGVKNIRYLTPASLAEALKAGSKKDIARAVWFDGKRQANRNGMISAIRKLPSHAPRTLLILQPRLTEKEHDDCKAKAHTKTARVMRFKQLNSLMLSARVAAMGAGADFCAIGMK